MWALDTRVLNAHFHDARNAWHVETERERVTALSYASVSLHPEDVHWGRRKPHRLHCRGVPIYVDSTPFLAVPHIFISYRREDSAANARLLHERLSVKFGARRVFMDVRDIDPGEEWKRRLDAEIERATHVIVMIGPRWLNAADAMGRRLDNPQDNVRWEVSESLRRGKRVIPVLVDQVGLPADADLPEPLRALSEKNFFTIGHLKFDKDAEALIEAFSGEVPPAVRLRLMKAALVVVPLVAAGALALARLDVFAIDAKAASFTMALGDMFFESDINPDLLLIDLRPGPDEGAKLRPSRRAEFARLIDTLSAAKAKRIVFDVLLTQETEYDADLGDSIRAAQASGIEVVFGFADIAAKGGNPVAAPLLAEAGAALGVACVGNRQDDALATLALVRDERNYPSLSLLAAKGPVQVNAVSSKGSEVVLRDGGGRSLSLPFSLLQRFAVTDRICPARSAGSEMARLIIPVSHRERWREPLRQQRLDEVLAGKTDAAAFSGKTVLIGAGGEHSRDRIRTRLDLKDPRFGFEFQADAINALMNGSVVRPLGWLGQAGLMLAMASLAAAYRLWRLDHRRRLDKSVLLLAVVLYVALTIVAYAQFRVLISPMYHMAALLMAWGVLAQLEKRWLTDAD